MHNVLSVITGQNLCMTGHRVNNLKKDKNTTVQHSSLKVLLLNAKMSFLICSFCLWKVSSQMITVISRGDNLPKKGNPFFEILFAFCAHLLERMTFRHLFLQNTNRKTTQWGISCFIILPKDSKYINTSKNKLINYELSRKHFFCCHGKLEPKSKQPARHWS